MKPMPNKLPQFSNKHKICVICEGNEEYGYLNRLRNLSVWNENYEITLVNACGNGNIPARYQDRIAENEEVHKALNTIRLITMVQTGSKFNYNWIRELNPLMDTVRTAHDKMLEEKRAEVLETVRQCMEATHTAANGDSKASHLIEKSDWYFSQCKEKIAELKSLALLDAMFLPMCQYKDDTVSNIESVLAPPAPKPPVQPTQPGKEAAPAKKKVVRAYNRQVVFQAKTLQTDADIDDYVEKIRSQLKQLLKNCDEIRLN